MYRHPNDLYGPERAARFNAVMELATARHKEEQSEANFNLLALLIPLVSVACAITPIVFVGKMIYLSLSGN